MLGSDEEIARRFECLEETQKGGVRPMTCCACFVNRVVVNFLLSLSNSASYFSTTTADALRVVVTHGILTILCGVPAGGGAVSGWVHGIPTDPVWCACVCGCVFGLRPELGRPSSVR
jgi:hypothetical protein